MPKLNKNEVIEPGSLALRFNIDLNGGHANNFLVDNVSRGLVDKLVVKYEITVLQTRLAMTPTKYFRIFSFRKRSVTTGWQRAFRARTSTKIAQMLVIRKHQKLTQKKKLIGLYENKYRIRFDHQILKDHGAFYLQALYNELVFELKLAAALNVARGSDL